MLQRLLDSLHVALKGKTDIEDLVDDFSTFYTAGELQNINCSAYTAIIHR